MSVRVAGVRVAKVLVIAIGSLVWLVGCESTSWNKLDVWGDKQASTAADPSPTGSIFGASSPAAPGASPGLLGSDPDDDLSLGKKHYRANDFGLAEKHFRRAVEQHPKDVEAWVGLAAAYDRLKRFDLADRAYDNAVQLVGQTPEILNNHGFSYLLRGDYARARTMFLTAQAKDPGNLYARNNLRLLEESLRKRKGVELPPANRKKALKLD
jgi:Flp pilus assembly protein TadD